MTLKDITNVYRTGEKQYGKTRPLLLKTKSGKTKWDVIKATKKFEIFEEER